MNLQTLFDTQKILRDRIGYNEPDRFNKLILALLVELGECANEWRGFKFWSKDQEPVREAEEICWKCEGRGGYLHWNIEPGFHREVKCKVCDGKGKLFYKPLLEEYVDGLHFVLEIGLELDKELFVSELPEYMTNLSFRTSNTITNQYLCLCEEAMGIYRGKLRNGEFLTKPYRNLVAAYLGLGEMLGFTEEQIEQAYFAKNQINHERQEQGY
ncbi:dUTP diphosphatase [Metabacillus fastidiosus]|uniref:dUTP diphosphatase n=1 Tax=Metabacillus fastidiosus TaxID=1458 RepID=UPI003D26DDAA